MYNLLLQMSKRCINKMNTLTLEHLKEKENISLVFIIYTMKSKLLIEIERI